MKVQTHTSPLSWGRAHRDAQAVVAPPGPDQLRSVIRDAASKNLMVLAYGGGRSYGDSCLNSGHRLISTRKLDCLRSFDENTGILVAEPGVTLDAILRTCVPKGWFLPVTPGTRFVTLGGAVANDIHGKEHHVAGSFGHHVSRLKVLRSDSEAPISLGPADDLFCATVGGLGLTGFIAEVTFQLKRIESAYLECDEIRFSTLKQFFDLTHESEEHWPYIVAWVDCVGQRNGQTRGIFSRARFLRDGRLDLHKSGGSIKSVPFEFPRWTLNRWSIAAFNEVFYRKQRADYRKLTTHYAPFFYPLDSITGWNRMYGSRGFYQYQCVVPAADEREATAEILRRIEKSGQGSFLSVLKRFGGKENVGLMSFPMPGTTLALDFRNQGDATHALFAELDAVVLEAGGRLYPAKDGRMPATVFEAGYSNLDSFKNFVDPLFSSTFWRRVAT